MAVSHRNPRESDDKDDPHSVSQQTHNNMENLVVENPTLASLRQVTAVEGQDIVARLEGEGIPNRTPRAATEKTSLLSQKQRADSPQDDNDKHVPSPSLTRWIPWALVCAACYALYNISIKKGSTSIHPILGGVLLQFVAALLGTLFLAGSRIDKGGGPNNIVWNRSGLYWATAAGLWVGTAEIVSFVVSGMGVPATLSIPIIIGGSVLFGSVLGVVLLHEHVMWHGWSGVLLLTIGIALVATDPGEKVSETGGANNDVQEELGPPPLLVWIGPALFCALSYALYNICIKKGSASINPIVGAVVLQFVTAIFGSAILIVVYLTTAENASITVSHEGIVWSCWAGLFVGAAELLSFYVSGMGVPASSSIPVLIGGSVGFGAVLGILMLGEVLELQGWGGVVLLMTGIALVATDPGEKVEGH